MNIAVPKEASDREDEEEVATREEWERGEGGQGERRVLYKEEECGD